MFTATEIGNAIYIQGEYEDSAGGNDGVVTCWPVLVRDYAISEIKVTGTDRLEINGTEVLGSLSDLQAAMNAAGEMALQRMQPISSVGLGTMTVEETEDVAENNSAPAPSEEDNS